jgi:acetyltransferase-like isoleucine patch superfamily enzyme/acyl carrier protein
VSVNITGMDQAVRAAILGHVTGALEGHGFDPHEIDDDFNLLESGVVDSFGVLELITAMEERFGLSLDLEDVEPVNLTTVGPLARLIAEACNGGPVDPLPVPVAWPEATNAITAPTAPAAKAPSAPFRVLGRGGANLQRLVSRARGKAFSLLVSGSFASFGTRTVLQPPIRLAGEGHISVGSGIFVGAGAWFQTLEDGDGGRGSISIGDGTSMAGNCTLSSARAIRIGRAVSFARGVYVADHAHAYDDLSLPVLAQGLANIAEVEIGDGAWLGQNVVVLPGVRIGRGAVVSANSVVAGNVPDFTVVAGTPARVVRSFGSPPA